MPSLTLTKQELQRIQMHINCKILIAIAFSTPVTAFCNTILNIYCLTSEEINSTQFEMREYTDRNPLLSFAFVKYRKSKTWIPLIATRSASTPIGYGAQDDITSSWLEISNKKPTGSYEMISQGAIIKSIRYSNFSTRKVYKFIHDPSIEFSAEKGCNWIVK